MCVHLCSCFCPSIRIFLTYFIIMSKYVAYGSLNQSHILRHSVSSCMIGSVNQTIDMTLGNRISVSLDTRFNAMLSHEKIREPSIHLFLLTHIQVLTTHNFMKVSQLYQSSGNETASLLYLFTGTATKSKVFFTWLNSGHNLVTGTTGNTTLNLQNPFPCSYTNIKSHHFCV